MSTRWRLLIPVLFVAFCGCGEQKPVGPLTTPTPRATPEVPIHVAPTMTRGTVAPLKIHLLTPELYLNEISASWDFEWQGAYSQQGDTVMASLPVGRWLILSTPGTNEPFWHYSFEWDGTPEIFLKVQESRLCVLESLHAEPFLTVVRRMNKDWTEKSIEATIGEATLTELDVDLSNPSDVAKVRRFKPKRLQINNGNLLDLPLDELTVLHAQEIKYPEAFSRMTKLKELSFFPGQRGISSLSTLQNLEHLEIHYADWGLDIGPLRSLNQLTDLRFYDCKKINDYAPIYKLDKLQALRLPSGTTDDDLKKLRDAGVLDNLLSLDVSGCKNLTTLSGLAGLKKIHTLNLRNCDGLKDFSGVATVTSLRAINLDRAEGFTDLSFLASLKSLRTLTVACANSAVLVPLGNCEYLESVFIFGPVGDLGSVPTAHLRELGLNGFKGTRLMSNLFELQVVHLFNCDNIDDAGVKDLIDAPKQLTRFFYSSPFESKFNKANLSKQIKAKFPSCYQTF